MQKLVMSGQCHTGEDGGQIQEAPQCYPFSSSQLAVKDLASEMVKTIQEVWPQTVADKFYVI